MTLSRRLLMVAFHFPPLAGSSGIQRTLRFVQQLPALGWQPAVLSAHPRAYERTADDLMAEVPSDVPVQRAFALDAARHLAIGGRYPGAWARPDRWRSWRLDGVRRGVSMAREHACQLLWSTYPIATAHTIAADIQQRTGLPWVADFRDPMAQENYPPDPRTRATFQRIEQRIFRQAALCTFTTEGAARLYRDRFPAAADRIVVIENGYDEESFVSAEAEQPRPAPLNDGALTLLHSGIVYPEERDPTALLTAVGRLATQGRLDPRQLRLRFRAAVHESLLQRLAAEHGLSNVVEILPPLPYRAALQEMRRADALLVLQNADCNAQVPAKLYEYLRAGRPILCLADAAGDTAGVVRGAGLADLAPLDDADAIASTLARFVDDLRDGRARRPGPDAVHRASRLERSRMLAAWLDRIVAARPGR